MFSKLHENARGKPEGAFTPSPVPPPEEMKQGLPAKAESTENQSTAELAPAEAPTEDLPSPPAKKRSITNE